MLTNLATVARAAGLKVVEIDGWKTRGHGQMSDVRTVTFHHTGASPVHSLKPKLSLNTVVHGRPGLEGPLAHYYIDRDGTVYVVAAGLAWHAGASLSTDYTNSHAIGLECEAAGDGWNMDWPAVQMDAIARLCRALVDAYKILQVADVRGHKETCSPVGRKPDPKGIDMASFRKRVAAVNLNPVKPDNTKEPEEMFLGAVSGSDPRVFLCGVAGKRELTAAEVKAFKDAGVRDAGDVSSALLNVLPTYDKTGTVGGRTVAQLNTIENNTKP